MSILPFVTDLSLNRNDIQVVKHKGRWVVSCADCWVFGAFATHARAMQAACGHAADAHATPAPRLGGEREGEGRADG